MNWLPYYVVCALMWFIAWAIGLWYYQSRQQNGPLLKRLSWSRRVLLFAALMLVPVAYGGSHAGYQQLVAIFPDQHRWLEPMADLYIPLQFLTLLLDGRLDWSFEPFLYPAALLVVMAVPFLIHRTVLLTRIRNPRFFGFMLVGLFAAACFAFMLGPL